MTEHVSDRQFARANREIEKTAAVIMRAIERLLERTSELESVAFDHVIEQLLLELLHKYDFVRLLDRMPQPGPVTLQLSNALHDYRDAPFEDH
jgi:hypothetical protein